MVMTRLEQKRRRMNLTQTQLAQRLRFSPTIISKLETQAWKPWKKLSKRLERFFGIPISELMAEVENDGKI